jgi:hypothetical protein
MEETMAVTLTDEQYRQTLLTLDLTRKFLAEQVTVYGANQDAYTDEEDEVYTYGMLQGCVDDVFSTLDGKLT